MRNDLDFIELSHRVRSNGGWVKSVREVRQSDSYKNDPKRRWLVRSIKVLAVVGVLMFLYEGVTCPTGKHYQTWCFSD